MKVYKFRLIGNREQHFQVPHPEHGGRTRPYTLKPGVVLSSDGEGWYEEGQQDFWLGWSELVESKSTTVREIPVPDFPVLDNAFQEPPAPAEPELATTDAEPEPKAPEPAPEPAVAPPEGVKLSLLTTDEVRSVAAERGIDVTGMSKAKMIEAIKAQA